MSRAISRRIKQPGRLFLAFAWCSSLALPQSDVRALLEQVGLAVRRRYLDGYVLDIDRLQRSQKHFNADGLSDRAGLPIPAMPKPSDGAHDRITLARLGKGFRYDIRNSADEQWQWITDGHTVWCYRNDLNVYTVTEANPWPERLGPEPGLPGVEWKYLTKFLAIADAAERAQILRDDAPPDKTCSGPSVAIELSLAEGSEPLREQLRVLARSHLPCQTVIDRTRQDRRAGPADSRETISWRFQDGPPAPGFLIFTPRAHAKRVKRIPRG